MAGKYPAGAIFLRDAGNALGRVCSEVEVGLLGVGFKA